MENRETYRTYYIKQTWALKDEYNDAIHINGYGFKPIKIFFFGKGNKIALSQHSIRQFANEGMAKRKIKFAEEMSKRAFRNSYYNITNTIEFDELYK